MPFQVLLIVLISLFTTQCNRNDHPQIQGYVEGEIVFFASPFYGVLKNLPVQRGNMVRSGQLLFALDSDPQAMVISQVQAELDQACNTLLDMEKPKRLPELLSIEAQIAQANTNIDLAKLRVDRLQKLYKRNATDQDSLDAAITHLQEQQQIKLQYQANLDLARLGARTDQIKAQQALVHSLLAKLNQAQWDLKQKTIFAPSNGVIFDTYYHQGEFVSAQQPVLSLLTKANTRIEFYAPLILAQRIKPGQNIIFNCQGCTKDNKARIDYISPDAEFLPPLLYSRENDAKLVFRVRARILTDGPFKPGQPIWVTL